jgi:hypothetical protein
VQDTKALGFSQVNNFRQKQNIFQVERRKMDILHLWLHLVTHPGVLMRLVFSYYV